MDEKTEAARVLLDAGWTIDKVARVLGLAWPTYSTTWPWTTTTINVSDTTMWPTEETTEV